MFSLYVPLEYILETEVSSKNVADNFKPSCNFSNFCNLFILGNLNCQQMNTSTVQTVLDMCTILNFIVINVTIVAI